MDDTSKELRAFLDYVAGKKSDDDFVRKLEEAVKKARKNREWRHEYMTLLMRDQENIEKGIQQGREEGIQQEREQGIKLIVESGKELGVDRKRIQDKIAEKYNLDEEQASIYMDRYWM